MHIKVRVTAGAKKEIFKKINEDTFEISVKEKAEGNRANGRMIELVAQNFAIEKGVIKIITGHHSSRKILFLDNKK